MSMSLTLSPTMTSISTNELGVVVSQCRIGSPEGAEPIHGIVQNTLLPHEGCDLSVPVNRKSLSAICHNQTKELISNNESGIKSMRNKPTMI